EDKQAGNACYYFVKFARPDSINSPNLPNWSAIVVICCLSRLCRFVRGHSSNARRTTNAMKTRLASFFSQVDIRLLAGRYSLEIGDGDSAPRALGFSDLSDFVKALIDQKGITV